MYTRFAVLAFCLVSCLSAMSVSQAASLHACPGVVQAAGKHEVRVALPDGGDRRVFVSPSERVEGCRSMRLPLPIHGIVGLKPVAGAEMGDTVLLHGTDGGQNFLIESVSFGASAQAAGPQQMPLRDNLLPGMSARSFGSEERVRISLADGRLHLQCEAGTRPAGVILRGPWRAGLLRADLALEGSGTGRFELQVLDEAAARREQAHALGSFDAAAGKVQNIALRHERFDPATWEAFVIVCPGDRASLQLDGLKLVPRAGTPAGRSAWVWDARAWTQRPEEVFAHARRHALKTLFIAVPVKEGKVADPRALAAFIRQAGTRGLQVWSVDGDAQMVLPQEHAPSAARVRAYARYNRSVEAGARLKGAQFDVEHYLLPGYELAVQAWDRRYIELAMALHDAAAGLPLEFVMPFWWADKEMLLQGLAPLAAGVTVMDYRTRREEISGLARPFLEWGARHGRQVRIALEAGPVAPERQRRFTRADAGELWLLHFEQTPILLLLDQARPNPHGPAFRQVSSRTLDGSATTFHADVQRLLRMLPELEAEFSAWPSFNGMALHELK